jgi:hypothetical protein
MNGWSKHMQSLISMSNDIYLVHEYACDIVDAVPLATFMI